MRTFFHLKKELHPAYSYAVFARQAKVAKSLPRDIIEGLKRLTDKTLPAFVRAMGLEGLLEEFFVQLLASEEDPSRKKLVAKLAHLYLETHFTKTYTDSNFSNYLAPFLYAASGEVGVGVDGLTLSQRTGLSLEEVRRTMVQLEELRLGRFLPEHDQFIPTIAQVHVETGEGAKFFKAFYRYCLKLQERSLEESFHSPGTLFLNEVFSVNEKDLPELKRELKKILKTFLLRSENPQGDSVAVLNLGLFKQNFSASNP